jgi:hypothetical protein
MKICFAIRSENGSYRVKHGLGLGMGKLATNQYISPLFRHPPP